jgi:serine/threonine protein kinase
MSTYDNQTGRLPSQSLLRHQYVIIGQAGKGGMGAVYHAIDRQNPNRHYAIKEMSQGHLSEIELREAIRQFQREADMLHRLSHPNLPHIYDYFEENGRTYLVMDFINGKTLFQMLKESGDRPLPVLQVLDYANQLCDVLTYLHQQNPPIIFRDLKPTNVMVTPDGHVFLIDFGIARFFTEGKATDTVFLGSPGYASPEQHGTAQTSPRSDLYSLGATLHCCLTGRDPYHAKDRFAFPPAHQLNPQVPLELDRLLQRMLAKNEQDRPASAIEVKQELANIRQHAIDDTRAISPTLLPTATPTPNVASSPVLAATQYAQPVPFSNKGSSTLPPTRAVASSIPNYSGRATAVPSTAVSGPIFARIWTRPFSIVFLILLVATVGGSILAFNIPHPYGPSNIAGLDHAVEFGLSLLVLLVCIYEGILVRGSIPRSILALTGLSVLLPGFVSIVQTLFDVHSLVLILPEANVLRTVGLVAAGLFSLIWLVRPFNLTDRLILLVVFGITVVCALLQSFFEEFGNFEVLKHILLLIILIMLILGVLIAAQMERVRTGANGA